MTATEPAAGDLVAGERPATHGDGASRRHVLLGGSWDAASRFVPVVGIAALSIVMARRLGASQLGLQSYIAYVGGLASALLVGTFTDASIRSLAAARGRGDPDTPALTRWVVVGHLATGAVTAGVLTAIGHFRSTHQLYWDIAAGGLMLDAIGWSYASRWIAYRGWQRVGALRLLSQSASVLGAMCAVLVGWGLAGVFWATAAASLLLVLLLSRRSAAPQGVWRRVRVGLLATWGWFVVTEAVGQVVLGRVELLFLNHYGTTTDVAVYSIPFALVTVAVLLSWSVFRAAMPAIATSVGAGRTHRVNAQLGQAWRVTLASNTVAAAALMALGPRIIELAYGRQYHLSADLITLMAGVLLFVPVASLCTAYWSGLGRFRMQAAFAAAGGAVDVGLAFALIPRYGAWGAAAVNVASQCLYAAAFAYYTWRASGRFPVVTGTLVATAGGGAGAIVAARVIQYEVGGWPGLFLGLVAFAAVLGTIGRAYGLLRAEDVGWLAEVSPRLRALAFFAGPAARRGAPRASRPSGVG